MPIIYGYKCFNENMRNQYGFLYEIGKTYHCKGKIRFQSNGIHFCKNLEDTFRYFDAFKFDVKVCFVKGFGKIDEYNDEYNGFYNIYCSQNMEIIKLLNRDDIINYMLSLYPLRVERFVSLFKLTDEEIKIFKNTFSNEERVIKAIDYYQLNDKEVYKRSLIKK